MCVYFCISFFTKKQCTFANKNEKLIDMARNKNILLTLTTESFMVLMASMVAFRLHESVVMPMEVSVFILVAIYACLKTLSILCLPTIKREASEQECVPLKVMGTEDKHNIEDVNIQKRRMELFHQEYQYEQQQYVQRKEKATVTQIALKNFAWNIAFQYNIGGDATALFVMHTFNEWFANSTLETIRKNLRTTTGRHKIEINEKIAN